MTLSAEDRSSGDRERSVAECGTDGGRYVRSVVMLLPNVGQTSPCRDVRHEWKLLARYSAAMSCSVEVNQSDTDLHSSAW